MRRTLALVAVAAALLAGLTACKKSKPFNGPPGDELLKAAATEMRTVTSAHFTIATEGNISLVSVRHADGRLTKEGNAQGTLQVENSGTLLEFSFTILGDTLYLKGATGGYQTLPLSFASSVYDPTAILDPDRGVVKVLETARDAKTEALEKVDGADAYRVAATFDKEWIGKLIPGVNTDLKGQVWIDTGRKLPVKARFTIPGETGSASATVTATFSEYDKPVNISAP